MLDKFRVLNIDDDATSLKVMSSIIGHHQWLEADSAISGTVALEMMRENEPYHIILSDLDSEPGSVKIVEASKAHSPDSKVIVIAGFGDHDLIIEAIKAGAYGYLHKPFRPEEMNLVLNNLSNHFQQWRQYQNLGDDIVGMENELQGNINRIEVLQIDADRLKRSLQQYEPTKQTANLNLAIAQATSQRTGTPQDYAVSQKLRNLANLLEDHKITDKEYHEFRRTILEKAYQVPLQPEP